MVNSARAAPLPRALCVAAGVRQVNLYILLISLLFVLIFFNNIVIQRFYRHFHREFSFPNPR